jgi:RimJ/RimL family protein N-acetyltransferase
MVIELQAKDFKIAEKLFSENLFQIPALAVLNSRFPGRVFVDNRKEPEIALVWALSRWSYISCREMLPEYGNFIANALDTIIIPLLKDAGENYFEIYADNNINWDEIIYESLKKYELSKHYENTFTLNTKKFKKLNLSLEYSEDIEFVESIFPIIPESYYKYLSFAIFDKNVYGMSIKKNGETISQCISNGFIHDNGYFIDLDTFAGEERNKGYGTFISYKLIDNLLKKDYLPLWETTVDNLPSQKVADKLGFEKVEEYPVYSVRNFENTARD